MRPANGLVECRNQPDGGRFSRTGRPDKRRYRAWPGFERNAVQHGLAGVIGELHVLELHFAHDGADIARTLGIFVLGPFAQHFAGALEARQRLADLRPDIDDADDGRDQENQIRVEHDQLADESSCRRKSDASRYT